MRKKTIFWGLLLLIVILPVLMSIHYDGTYSGKVVDAETGEPIEGAVVLGIRQLEVWAWVDAKLKYFDASEAISDKEGRFKVPAVIGFYLWPFGRLGMTEFIVFKPGYDSYPPYDLRKTEVTKMTRVILDKKIYSLVEMEPIKAHEERSEVLSVVSFPLFTYEEEGIEKKTIKLLHLIDKEKEFLDAGGGK